MTSIVMANLATSSSSSLSSSSTPLSSSSFSPSSSSSSTIAITSSNSSTTAMNSTTNHHYQQQQHNHNPHQHLNHQLDELGKSNQSQQQSNSNSESNLNQRSSVLISSSLSSTTNSSSSTVESSSNLVIMNGKNYKNCSSSAAAASSSSSSSNSSLSSQPSALSSSADPTSCSVLGKPKSNLIIAPPSLSSDCGATTNPPIIATPTTSNNGSLLPSATDIKTEPESPPPNSRANSGSSAAVIHFNSSNSSSNCSLSSSNSGHPGMLLSSTVTASTNITSSSPSSTSSAGPIASTTSTTSTPSSTPTNHSPHNIMDFHQVSVSAIPNHHNSHPQGPASAPHHHNSHVATVVGQTTITPVHPHQQQQQQQIHSHHSHPQHHAHHQQQQQQHHHQHSGTLHPNSNSNHSNGGSLQSSTTILTIPQQHPHSQNHIGSSGGPVVTAATSTPSNSDTTTNPKEAIDESCPVCGDRVSGYHYGLLTCESCKGFFKRTVQNKKVYTCVADRTCHIDKSQRKRCPYCRFQKCLDVGMKLEAVRADRMRGGRNKFGPMYKRDRARRLQIMRQKQFTKIPHGLHSGHGSHGHHNSPVAGMLGPPGSTLLPTDALNFLGVGGAGSGASHLFDGVKQELIQIPQLSSSTSSPDSSPSPGNGAINQAVAAAAAAAAAQLAATGGSGQGNAHHFIQPSVSLQATNANLQQQSGPNGGSGSSIPSMINSAASDHLLKWSNGAGTSSKSSSSNSSTNSGMHNNYNDNNNNNNNSNNNSNSHLHSNGNSKLIIPQLIRELQISMPDDKEWQAQLFGLLQNQTYNQCEVDLFELMCKVIDQSLFAQVDWARNSIFFKDLKVDDQMKLLQHAWSDMLVLDHIHQRLHVCLPDETTLPNGQKFDLLSLALLGVPQVADQLHRVAARLQELKLDSNDYICLKFLLLLNPEVRGLTNYKLVQEAHDQTKQALHEYTVNFYSQISDKFNHLLSLVPEIRALTMRGEDFLYFKHVNGMAPTQTLLMEMLHAKKK